MGLLVGTFQEVHDYERPCRSIKILLRHALRASFFFSLSFFLSSLHFFSLSFSLSHPRFRCQELIFCSPFFPSSIYMSDFSRAILRLSSKRGFKERCFLDLATISFSILYMFSLSLSLSLSKRTPFPLCWSSFI